MTLSEIQNKLKDLAVKDIGYALETLRTLAKQKDLYNMILLKQSSHTGLKKRIRIGDLSPRETTQQTNRLMYDFTEIVDEIEEDQIIMDKAIEVLQSTKENVEAPKEPKLREMDELGMDEFNKIPPSPSSNSGIYISYAWGGDSEKIVDQLDKELQEKGVKVIRDKRDLGYKGSIVEFMKDIGKGNKIIVVISKKYLESENCMFELTQVHENKDFAKRIFPIVLEDSNIYSPISRVKYIKYWNDKIAELDEAIKSVGTALNMSQLQQELNNYGNIRASFDNMAFILKDMNALTPDMHRNQNFEMLYKGLVG